MGGDALNSPSSVSDDQSQHSLPDDNDHPRKRKAHPLYSQIFHSYDKLASPSPSRNLKQDKAVILGYKPGTWTDMVRDHVVPETTSLLVIGPRGSGKSTLINTISKVFDDGKFATDRAQVSYNPCGGDGTVFLQGYLIPTSICLYDTRSLSDDHSQNAKMLKRWMTKGVNHGELVIKNSDDSSFKCRMRNIPFSVTRRKVNFVMIVVDGLSVLKSMESDGEEYIKLISQIFNSPYLSFKDDKPAVVVTHGDLLSTSDRTRIRMHLGQLFGISPSKQIFDIPDCCDPVVIELPVVDLLRYSLERADRNLPHYDPNKEVCQFLQVFLPMVLLMLFITAAAAATGW